MKLFSINLLILSSLVFTGWETDFELAKQKAHKEHKYILLNFSGSDWCGPCIRLHKEIFNDETFRSYADQNLILVNADFPRLKKNMLSKEQQQKNEALADLYNREGLFPLTVLVNAEGKAIKKWEGFPSMTAAQFTNDVKAAVDANR